MLHRETGELSAQRTEGAFGVAAYSASPFRVNFDARTQLGWPLRTTTVAIHGGEARCVMASNYTLNSPD